MIYFLLGVLAFFQAHSMETQNKVRKLSSYLDSDSYIQIHPNYHFATRPIDILLIKTLENSEFGQDIIIKVKELLEKGASLETLNNKLQTPLKIVFLRVFKKYKNSEIDFNLSTELTEVERKIIQLLFDYGASDIDERIIVAPKWSLRPLLHLSMYRDIQSDDLLSLSQSEDLLSLSLVSYCIYRNNFKLFELLLENGAMPDKDERFYNTISPIALALFFEKKITGKYFTTLLKYGANLKCKAFETIEIKEYIDNIAEYEKLDKDDRPNLKIMFDDGEEMFRTAESNKVVFLYPAVELSFDQAKSLYDRPGMSELIGIAIGEIIPDKEPNIFYQLLHLGAPLLGEELRFSLGLLPKNGIQFIQFLLTCSKENNDMLKCSDLKNPLFGFGRSENAGIGYWLDEVFKNDETIEILKMMLKVGNQNGMAIDAKNIENDYYFENEYVTPLAEIIVSSYSKRSRPLALRAQKLYLEHGARINSEISYDQCRTAPKNLCKVMHVIFK